MAAFSSAVLGFLLGFIFPIYKYIRGVKSCSVLGLHCCGRARKDDWGEGQTDLALRRDEEGAAERRGLYQNVI